MQTVCLIPIKHLETVKSRLSSHFTNMSRRKMFMYMLGKTICAVNKSSIKECWLLSSDAEIELFANKYDVQVFSDCPSGLNPTLNRYVNKAFDLGYNAMYLAPDLPLINAASISQILKEFSSANQMILVPDLDKIGINAIIWKNNHLLGPFLGINSYQVHLRQAKIHNMSVVSFEHKRLQCDLDTVEQFNNLPDSVRSKLLSL